MTYEKVKNLNPEEFKRFCGVYPETFKDMVKVLGVEKVLPVNREMEISPIFPQIL